MSGEKLTTEVSGEKLTAKDYLQSVSILLGVVIVAFLLWAKPSSNTTQDILEEIPDISAPIDLGNEVPNPNFHEKILEIIPPNNPQKYSADAFSRFQDLAYRIIADGKFKDIKLKLKTETDSKKDGGYLLSLTLDNESGIYRSYRESAGRINLTKTEKLGGLLKVNNPIEIPLNEEILIATTGKEFSLTQAPNWKVNFWKSLLVAPPTVFRFLALPINSENNFDLQITELKITYTCENENNACNLLLCKKEEPNYYSCLLNNLGKTKADSWLQRSGLAK